MFAQAIAYLNSNSGALTVIFTAVVTISTVAYAILTRSLVSETKKMREVQTEPRIEIILKPLDSAINIVRLNVRNIGLGPAKNVKFTSNVSSGGEGAEKLLGEFNKANFLKTGLKYFGPGHELHSGYTQITKDFDAKVASVLIYGLEYESITGKKYSDQITIDLSELKGMNQLGKPNLYAITQSIEAIQKDFSHVLSGFKKIHADVYTSEDRDREAAEERAYIEKMKQNKNSHNHGMHRIGNKSACLPVMPSLAPPAASPMRRCPYRVHVPVGAAAGGTNQAIGHRCHLLAWPSAPQAACHGSTPHYTRRVRR